MEDERQIDTRGQAGTQREDGDAAGRQAPLRAGIGGQPPGQHRDERTDDHRTHLGGCERRAEHRHGNRGEERRQREPDLEGGARHRERRRLVAPQGITDEAAAVEQVAGDADVVGRVLRLGEDDQRRGSDAHDDRDRDDGEHGRDHLVARHPALAAAPAHRVSDGSTQTA
ncbi:MAG: hypothetical protein E6J17_07010 [Chloroflexi bacterium]|nr:MAG: hypothetical protein E6J17_07010 [Chloroflexota bacterium]